MKINSLLLALTLTLISCEATKTSTVDEKDLTDSLVMEVSAQVMDSLLESYPSYNADFPPPPDAKEVFKLSQDYPTTLPESEAVPWKSVDFKKSPEQYLKTVLKYCLEGNIDANFEGQNNKIRKWFHAPWLHFGANGREYIHGLTRERGTPKFELHQSQDILLENWAVGMYNAPGGFAIGRVWNSNGNTPTPENATFPEGTCTFKLLFTDGDVEKVPFLKGTLEWDANIYANARSQRQRLNRRVRLLQIDVAVKDDRAKETGWVFGTFIYDASAKGNTPWEKMVPVGLSWHDDSQDTTLINKEGAFVNASLKGSYINENLIEDPARTYSDEAYMRHHGLGGRLNGPVDNPISSCVSCHARAATYKGYSPFNSNSGKAMPMGNFSLTRSSFTVGEFNKYFYSIPAGSHSLSFENVEYITTDYSLQLSAGIRNYFQSARQQIAARPALVNAAKAESASASLKNTFLKDELPPVTRGEN